MDISEAGLRASLAPSATKICSKYALKRHNALDSENAIVYTFKVQQRR
jgi:hypothetical protein